MRSSRPSSGPSSIRIPWTASASTTGTDVEFLEIDGTPGTDYSDLDILAVGGDSASATPGRISASTSVGSTGPN